MIKSTAKRALKLAGYPVIRYFSPRFHGIHERMDRVDQSLADIRGLVAEIQRRLGEFERNISTDIETTMEVLLTHQRSTALLQEQIYELKRLLDRMPAELGTGEDRAGR
ncbi:MAG TPA: hypothetical protein VHJ78_00325 [Actinomycetota bacterium]|nr:hypothetical protein [Actinomycetota bacterium]